MKWIYYVLFIFTLALTGCSNDLTSQQSKEKMFYSKHKDSFIIVTIGKELDLDSLRVNRQDKIESIFNIKTLDIAKKNYKFLKANKSPEFYIFNYKKMILKTNNYNQIVNYLRVHNR